MLAYLDHAASAKLDPAAVEAMTEWLAGRYGNPSGSHQVARAARAAIDDVRDRVAKFVGSPAGDVTFTSGGTEADNLAVLGVAARSRGPVVISAVEHPAVTEAASASGREVRIVGVGEDGVVDIERLRVLVDDDVSLVSIQLANHETGVIQPLGDIARRIRKWAPHALIHTDAVQAAPWIDLTEAAAGADLVSISGHKLGGPQGIGALVARGRPELQAVLHGGGQERELRSGTQNVLGIVGMGAAIASLQLDREGRARRVAALRDELAGLMRDAVPDCVETAAHSSRIPGHLHLLFPGVESESLLVLLDEAGVCASAGAACASGAMEPSPVLLAMGVDKHEAGSSLRLTLGPTTTREEVSYAAQIVAATVARLRRAGR